MISDEVLNEVRERVVNGFHPDKIILFGSPGQRHRRRPQRVFISGDSILNWQPK
jgi:hypothetical protein